MASDLLAAAKAVLALGLTDPNPIEGWALLHVAGRRCRACAGKPMECPPPAYAPGPWAQLRAAVEEAERASPVPVCGVRYSEQGKEILTWCGSDADVWPMPKRVPGIGAEDGDGAVYECHTGVRYTFTDASVTCEPCRVRPKGGES